MVTTQNSEMLTHFNALKAEIDRKYKGEQDALRSNYDAKIRQLQTMAKDFTGVEIAFQNETHTDTSQHSNGAKPKKKKTKKSQLSEAIIEFVKKNGKKASASEIREAILPFSRTLFPNESTAKSAIRTEVFRLKKSEILTFDAKHSNYSIH